MPTALKRRFIHKYLILSFDEKSTYLFPLSSCRTGCLSDSSTSHRWSCGHRQNRKRHAFIHLSGFYHDQCRTRIWNRQNQMAFLCSWLFYRYDNGGDAVDSDLYLLCVGSPAAWVLVWLGGMEGNSADEPFRRSDLCRNSFHDAGCIEVEVQLDVQENSGARDFRWPWHDSADDSSPDFHDRNEVADGCNPDHSSFPSDSRLEAHGVL